MDSLPAEPPGKHVMWYAGLDESQAKNQIAGRNINNLRNADDTTLRVECEEELKSLFIRVREETEKADLTQHSKN